MYDDENFRPRAFWSAAALTALTTSAFAQAAAPTPWVLAPDMGYGYDKDGKTFSYKMGTNNAKPAAEGRQESAQGHVVLHRRERPALHAQRPVSRRRRQVHVRAGLRIFPSLLPLREKVARKRRIEGSASANAAAQNPSPVSNSLALIRATLSRKGRGKKLKRRRQILRALAGCCCCPSGDR